MRDDEDAMVVIAAIGLIIAIIITMAAWAFTGGLRAPTATDNCPVEYKTK